MILLLTWNPFSLTLPGQLQLSFRIGPRDALANILLFLPVGFVYCLGGGRWWGAILLGALVSTMIETVQFFIPGRTPSAVDLAMNTFGSAWGAGLYNLFAARIAMTPRMVGRLGLEVPLMGLLYLMVPLLWVNRLVPGEALTRWLLTGLIGACGAIILSDIFQQWWGPVRMRSIWQVMIAFGTWFLVGVGPSLLSQPLVGSGTLVGTALLAAAFTVIPRTTASRRFERATLGRLLPVFILYLLLQAFWPFLRPLEMWHGSFGLTDPLAQEDIRVNIRLIEHLAAFTALGYITAEWHGRAELSWKRDLPQLFLLGMFSALTLEIPAGFQAGPGASFLRLMIATGGALFGGILYHLQRDHVRFLLGRPPQIRSS